jgi:hypothetical protein
MFSSAQSAPEREPNDAAIAQISATSHKKSGQEVNRFNSWPS